MTDERCEAAARGDLAATYKFDASRGWRWALAINREDIPAIDKIEAELAKCPNCLTGVAGFMSGMVSGLTISRIGKDASAQFIKERIAAVERGEMV